MSAADGLWREALVDDGEPPTVRALPVLDDRGRPRRTGARGVTVSIRRLGKRELARGHAEYPPGEFADLARPQTRADCVGHEGPCPWVSCRHHLYLDVNPHNGNIKINFPDREVWELPETCALDVADRDGLTLEEVGDVLNLTRERIRQLETIASEALKALPSVQALARDEIEQSARRGEVPVSDDGSGERTDADALAGLSEMSYGGGGAVWGVP